MDGDVVGTAAVKAYLPLRAAPVLSIERLASVSELTVQIHNYPSAGLPGPPSLTASAAEGTFDKVYHVTSAERCVCSFPPFLFGCVSGVRCRVAPSATKQLCARACTIGTRANMPPLLMFVRAADVEHALLMLSTRC